MSVCQCFICVAYRLGLQFLGGEVDADLVSLFLKSKSKRE